jgi:mRNA-degrading endonuclease RelE of RelBE toxin-antitoxin system
MTPRFRVLATSHFERAVNKLSRHHPEFEAAYFRIVSALETDPYNRSRSYDIKKLQGVPKGQSQYRIRAGRFRFRYDIEGETVYLKACSLRREDTYS